MISYQHRCIFVKVPKTAGTSIARILNCEHVGKPHRSILEIRDLLEVSRKSEMQSTGKNLSEDWFYEYYKFGFVRNPWDRVVSLYNRKESGQVSEQFTFAEFVNWINYASDTCVHPSRHKYQRDWFVDRQNNIHVDFIGKFENLDNDWKKINTRLNINLILPHLRDNKDNKKHYTEYYNKKMRDIIAKKFRVDIDYFEYSFGD